MVDRRHTGETASPALRIGRTAVSALLIFMVGCGGGGDTTGASATATARFSEGMEGLQGGVERGMPATVSMVDGLRFEPAQVTVPAGTTVLWRNTSTVEHTVTANPARVGTPSNVQLPAGVDPFESEGLAESQTFSQQLTVAGEYRYVCRIHEGSGMQGMITVQ